MISETLMSRHKFELAFKIITWFYGIQISVECIQKQLLSEDIPWSLNLSKIKKRCAVLQMDD